MLEVYARLSEVTWLGCGTDATFFEHSNHDAVGRIYSLCSCAYAYDQLFLFNVGTSDEFHQKAQSPSRFILSIFHCAH